MSSNVSSNTQCSASEFDAAGRAIFSVSGNLGECTPETFVISMWKGTAVDYDNQGRTTATVSPSGSSSGTIYTLETIQVEGSPRRVRSTFNYDSRSEKEIFVDAVGNRRLIREHQIEDGEPIVYESRYDYDPLDNMVKFTDHYGNSSSFVFNAMGEKIRAVDMDLSNCESPEDCAWIYEYDARGQLVSQTDAREQQIQNFYDIAGNLVCSNVGELVQSAEDCDCNIELSPSGDTEPSLWNSVQDYCYFYDYRQTVPSAGKRTTMIDPSGYTRYSHDEFGNVEKVEKYVCLPTQLDPSASDYPAVECEKNITESRYDVTGALLQLSTGNLHIAYSYDGFGRISKLTRVDSVGAPQEILVENVSYNDQHGLGTELTSTSTYLEDGSHVRSTYSYYDRANPQENEDGPSFRLKNATTEFVGGDQLQNQTYKYSLDGQIEQLTDLRPLQADGLAEETWSYQYDKLKRLVSATLHNGAVEELEYSYDAIGNRTSVRHTVPELILESPMIAPFCPVADFTSDRIVNLSDVVAFSPTFLDPSLDYTKVPWADLNLKRDVPSQDQKNLLGELVVFSSFFVTQDYGEECQRYLNCKFLYPDLECLAIAEPPPGCVEVSQGRESASEEDLVTQLASKKTRKASKIGAIK